MSKRTGDRARFNREHKKRVQRRKRTQDLRQTLAAGATAGDAPNPARKDKQPATIRLRQTTGDEKAGSTAFEIVVYQVTGGKQNE